MTAELLLCISLNSVFIEKIDNVGREDIKCCATSGYFIKVLLSETLSWTCFQGLMVFSGK